MMDILNRNILDPKTLREKRRHVQLEKINQYHSSQEQLYTDIALQPSTDIGSFVQRILDKNTNVPTPSIASITQDYIVLKQNEKEQDEYIKFSLQEFLSQLKQAFEDTLTSTALCFVADASSSLGLDMIESILMESNAGMAIVSKPQWMLNLSILASTSSSKITKEVMDQAVFALARLDAHRVRKNVGSAKTVLFTLNMAWTAPLLQHLQQMFPCERHVFVYDSLSGSLARGLGDSWIPFYHPITKEYISTNIPLMQLTSVAKIDKVLAKTSFEKACLMESWLTSVDAFLQLKHNEKKSGYIPFVCRLGFLLSQVGTLGNGSVDQSELALTNLLQYVTGSRSREIPATILSKAVETMIALREEELQNLTKRKLNEYDHGIVEEAAFEHKGILLENKTLMDTVQPKVDWSLKAAKKLTSCACCMIPGAEDNESDDEEGDEDNKKNKSDSIVDTVQDSAEKSNEKAMFTAAPTSNYVDGKAMFAFDPSKFTGI